MAIFTGIAAAIGTIGTFIGGLGTVGTFALQAAVGVGLSLASQALAGKPPEPAAGPGFSIQGKLQAGGTVPRSFILGRTATAGSLVYANTWGQDGETPNAYLTQVIALSDLPVTGLAGVLVNGIECTMTTTPPSSTAPMDLLGEAIRAAIAAGLFPFMGAGLAFVSDYIVSHGGGAGTGGVNEKGAPLAEYRKDGKDHLWVKFYDGTQTAVDAFLGSSVTSTERPWGPDRIGKGVAYAAVTALVNDTLFTGFPSFKFVVQGVPLYDPTKDPSAGGSGSHEYADPATWGGDGDDLPAVQTYNLMRGITYNGEWVYGLQNMASARLPVTNWQTQIDKCRALIDGPDGDEATYLSGGEVSVSSPVGNCLETILTTCQGKIAETGGFYKMRVGAPDAPVMSFTDGEILSTEEQSFTPFFGLSDTITGITGKHPSPAEAWAVKSAPPLYRDDLEELAGNRRLLSDVSFDFVSRDAQVQRLMKSALDTAQRARRHTFSLPPEFWLLEPLDTVEWTSERNGYDAKLMEVDGLIDQANLDVCIDMTEVDPSDYNPPVYVTPTYGPMGFIRPSPQAIIDWYAEGIAIEGDTGTRRAALFLQWDGNQPDVAGVAFEVRCASDLEVVHRGRTDNPAAGSVIISQSILPSTTYGVRGRYIPASPRDTLWSSWLAVTTPDVLLSAEEFEGWIKERITTLVDQNEGKFDDLRAAIQVVADMATKRFRTDAKLKGEVSKINERMELRVGKANASIETVRELAVSTEGALAELTVSVGAQFEETNANVTSVTTALADLDTSFSSFSTSATAQFGTLNSSVTTNSTAIATLNGMVGAEYSVTLDVNGYASGFGLIAGGGDISEFYVNANKFVVALPSYGGFAPFVIGTINGGAAIGITGNVFLDGTLHARAIQAGTVDALQLKQDGVTVDKIVANAVSKYYTANLSSPFTIPNGSSLSTWSSYYTVCDSGLFVCPTAASLHISGAVYAVSNGINSAFSGGTYKIAGEYIEVSILVDGSAIYTKQYKPNVASYSGSIVDVPQVTNYTMPLNRAVAVTAGSHQVVVRVRSYYAYTFPAPTIEEGGITVTVSNKTTIN